MINFYHTSCPKCLILEKKLNQKGIKYNEITDKDLMIKKGFTNVPVLEVDGEIMEYMESVKWINGIDTEREDGE